MTNNFRADTFCGLSVLQRPAAPVRALLALAALTLAPAMAFAAPPIAGDDTGSTRSGPTAGAEITIDASLNDSDPEGGPLTYVLASGEYPGIASISPSGLVSYTPPADFTGDVSFGYIVTDAEYFEVFATVTVTVVADVAPVANNDTATATTFQATQVSLLDNDSDVDGDTLVYDGVVIVQPPSHGTVVPSCSDFCQPPIYQSAPGYTGPDSFTYYVVDALGAQSNTATVTVTVTAPNAPPVAGDDAGSARSGRTAGEQIQINAAANDSDPDGDSLTWTLDSGSYSATIEMSPTGVITYTPPPDITGVDTFSYTVTDGINPPVTGNVTVTVVANQAPVASADSVSTPAATAVSIAVLANDTDPDGDVLSYAKILIPQEPLNGSLTQTCEPECQPLDYVPNAGFVGNDTFTYRVLDALGDVSNIATVTITVTDPNTAPVAVDDAIVLPLNLAPQTIDPRTNDTDADGDPLTITAVTQASAGTVTFTATSVTYTNSGSFSEADSFTYTVADGQGGTATATVVVTLAANSPPVAGADTGTTRSGPTAGEQVTIDASLNDSDPDNDTLSFSAGIAPANGTVIVSPSGLLRYTPNPGFTGVDTFSYTVTDGINPPVTGNVSVTVVANQVPVANADSATAPAATAVSIPVLANDTDPDGDALDSRVLLVQQPTSGTVNQDCSDVCLPPQYTPNAGFVGNDTFTYRAVDALGGQSNLATVTITVTTVNTAPVAVDDAIVLPLNLAPQTIDPRTNDTDADGDPLTITAVTQASAGTVTFTATSVTYTNSGSFSEADSFTYTVADGQGGTATATVVVTLAPNSPPVANDDSATTPAATVVSIPVLANDTDPDGDALDSRVVLVQQPASGTVNQECSDVCLPPEYTPNAGFVGNDTFTYRAVDALGAQSNIATVTIAVTAVALPAAVDDTAITDVDTLVSIDVSANDSNPGNRPLTVTLSGATSQQGGTLAITAGTSLVEYTPPSGFSGQDSFTYILRDDLLNESSATVTVTVNAANQLPVAVIAGGNRSVADTDGAPGETVTFDSTQSTDADGTVSSCEWTVNGVGQDASCGASVPFALNDGSNTVQLVVFDDSEAASAPATVTITVQSNAAPTAVIAGGNRSVADTNGVPGEAVAVDGSASSDGTGTISAYQWSVNGQPVAGASGARPTLALDDGANTVSLVVVDNVGLSSAPAQVIITVGSLNAAPVVSIKVGSTSIPDGDGKPGENVPFSGVATDADGSVAVDSFRWTVNGQAVVAANGVANPLLALADGSNAVSLSATDNGGATGSQTITVVIGDPGALAELPGVKGNKNLENTAKATDSTCSALLKANPAQLTPEQVDLRTSCESIYANVEENPDDIADALRQVSGQQVTALQTTAIDFTSSQLFNVAERLTALRRGASGVSAAGLNVTGANVGMPLFALESLSKTLFGEGGSGGDDEGGLFDDRLGFFMNGSIRFGDKEATSRESGFDIDTQGVTLGADYRFTDALVAGLALGYGKASADFDANGGSQDSDSYSGSLYGSWYGQRSYFDGIASFGSVSYDTLRKIDLFDGAVIDQALGSTDGTQLALGLATGMDFGKSGLRFGPNLALNYIKVDIDGFRERTTGSSGLAMSFSDQSADSLRLKAGGHFSYSYSRKWGILSPQARFDIVREFANESQQVSVRYANDPTFIAQGGAGGTFVIFTDDPDDYYFLWAVGFAAQFVNGLSGFIDYEQTDALDTITSGEFSLGLRYQTSFR